MKATLIFHLILPSFALFALTDSKNSGSNTRLLNIYRDAYKQGYYGQNRTLISRSRATQWKTTTNHNSTSTTSNQTIVKPTTTKTTLLFAIYEKPAWTLAQMQQLQYYKNNATRNNSTTYRTSTVNATKHIRSSTNNTEHAKAIEIKVNETTTEAPTTTTTTTNNTTLHATDETTHDTPKYNEAHTLPAYPGQNELYHISETTNKPTTQKAIYRPIYFGKVNKKTTGKKQGRRTRRRRTARPAYNTSKLLAFL